MTTKTEVSHTPGPWTYDGKFTVGIPHESGDTYFRTNPEDARLIVAAPDLLKACSLAEETMCGATFVEGTDRTSLNHAIDKCKAAIAKAKGNHVKI